MLKLKPEYLTKNGRREYGVLRSESSKRITEGSVDGDG